MRGAKIVSLSLSAALLAGMVGLTACGSNTESNTDSNNVGTQSVRNKDGRNIGMNSVTPGNRQYSTRSTGHGQTERIKSLKYSSGLSNKVAQLSDVKTAHVVVTDRDAYVAVTLHGQNGATTHSRMSGMSATGLGNNRGIGMTGTTNYGGPYGEGLGTRGAGDNGLARGLTGRSGVAGGLLDITRGNDLSTGRNPMGTGTYGMRSTNNMMGTNTNMGTRSGANMTGTGTGTMSSRYYNEFGAFGTGNTAGSVTDAVPQKVKEEISRVVKKTAPHIRNVYVSSDTEFVTQVGTYSTHSRGGATLNGFITDFERMVQRVFPTRTGTMTGPKGYAPTMPNGTSRTGNNTVYPSGVSR